MAKCLTSCFSVVVLLVWMFWRGVVGEAGPPPAAVLRERGVAGAGHAIGGRNMNGGGVMVG